MIKNQPHEPQRTTNHLHSTPIDLLYLCGVCGLAHFCGEHLQFRRCRPTYILNSACLIVCPVSLVTVGPLRYKRSFVLYKAPRSGIYPHSWIFFQLRFRCGQKPENGLLIFWICDNWVGSKYTGKKVQGPAQLSGFFFVDSCALWSIIFFWNNQGGLRCRGGGGINGNPHSFYILQFVSESESELEFGSI